MKTETESKPEQSSWFKKIIATITGVGKQKSKLIQTVREQANLDIIDEDTASMVEGVLNVHELRVADVMVSRSQMITVNHASSLSQIIETAVKSGHSRFPVTGDNKDEILGIVLAKDLLPLATNNDKSKFNLQDIIRTAVFIPESKRLDSLLQEFKDNRNHMAIVVDEYGGITGLITIEDVIEQIVGNIEDEYDIDNGPLFKQIQENIFLVKALAPLERFNDIFSCSLSCEDVDTIGGLVMRKFGRMPTKGETISIEDLQFKIIRSDNRRLYILEVTRIS